MLFIINNLLVYVEIFEWVGIGDANKYARQNDTNTFVGYE